MLRCLLAPDTIAQQLLPQLTSYGFTAPLDFKLASYVCITLIIYKPLLNDTQFKISL